MLRAVATLAVLSATLTACGGGSANTETERARAVVERYRAALAAQNAAEMCSLLTEQAQREVATLAAALTAAPKGREVAGCVGFSRLFASNLARGHGDFLGIKVTRIGVARVTGEKATVPIREANGTSREIMLVKTPLGWRISLPGPGTTSLDLRGGPDAVTVEPPPTVAKEGKVAAQFYAGRTVVAQSGCLACHRIGEAGNAGPGPDLTHVGARLPPLAIERALIKPTAPMPSFRNLPKARLRALVTFLSQLRE